MRVEAIIQTAICINPLNAVVHPSIDVGIEETANDDLAVNLHGDAVNATVVAQVPAWVEAKIQSAVSVEPRDFISRRPVHLSEVATKDNFTVGLQSYANDADPVSGNNARIIAGV